jgi:Holliday junction resolvase RusA-like endonuclease
VAEPLVAFFVDGIPVPQGSKGVAMRPGAARPNLFDTNGKDLRPWRGKVKKAAQAAWRDLGRSPIGDPVQATILFLFPPVPSAPDRHWTADTPDIDKLERALYDGLKDGGMLRDDKLVVKHLVAKRYVEPHEKPGVSVELESLADHEALASARRLHERTRRR